MQFVWEVRMFFFYCQNASDRKNMDEQIVVYFTCASGNCTVQ